MPDYKTISSYLVDLGFRVDDASSRLFTDALKRSDEVVKRFAFGSAENAAGAVMGGVGAVGAFAAVGGAFATAAVAVIGATVGLASAVAKSDLQYQLMGRRLFMTTDAVRKMDMATKTLGMSLEEVIFGPREVQERYHQLIQDETKMLGYLGGDQGEAAFRHIRDIEFQFSRMIPTIQILGMKITEDVMDKLFGGHMALDERLTSMVNWIQDHIPEISDDITNYLVPALKLVAEAMKMIYEGLKFIVDASKNESVREFVRGFMFLPRAALGMADKLDPMAGRGVGSDLGGIRARVAAAANAQVAGPEAVAQFMALIEQESHFKTDSNKRTGAIGLGQVLPGNWPAGKDPNSVDDQLSVAASIFFGNLGKHGGNLQDALHDYYGHGKPGPGEPTFDEYYSQYMSKYRNYSDGGGATYQPQALHINVGGIHISQPGATADHIEKAVYNGIAKATRDAAQAGYPRAIGSFA